MFKAGATDSDKKAIRKLYKTEKRSVSEISSITRVKVDTVRAIIKRIDSGTLFKNDEQKNKKKATTPVFEDPQLADAEKALAAASAENAELKKKLAAASVESETTTAKDSKAETKAETKKSSKAA